MCPNNNIGFKKVLSLQRRFGEPPQHGDLPDVRQHIGDGSLEELIERSLERSATGKKIVKLAEDGEEPLDILIPRLRSRFMPYMLLFGHDQSPVEHIANVSQNLARRAPCSPYPKIGKVVRRAEERFSAAIGNCR